MASRLSLSRCASNEFESDVSSRGLHLHQDVQSILSPDSDAYDELDAMDPTKLHDILSKPQTRVLFDSLVKVYSGQQQQYVDVAAIVTKQRALYFTSAQNYQIWQQLRQRTRIDELVDDNEKINKEQAWKLCDNLDLVDRDKQKRKQIPSKYIVPYFANKTPQIIKNAIVCNATRIQSLCHVFGINDEHARPTHARPTSARYPFDDGLSPSPRPFFDSSSDDVLQLDNARPITPTISATSPQYPMVACKMIHCVRITNIEAIPKQKIDAFMAHVFEDVAYCDEEASYSSKVIVLKRYYTADIIKQLNQRIKQFCHQLKQKMGKSFGIVLAYNYNPAVLSLPLWDGLVKCLDLGTCDKIRILDADIPFCVSLSRKKHHHRHKSHHQRSGSVGISLQEIVIVRNKEPVDNGHVDDDITFQLNSFNQRMEWMAWIDYAMKHQKYLQQMDAETDAYVEDDLAMEDFKEDRSVDQSSRNLFAYMDDFAVSEAPETDEKDGAVQISEEFCSDFNFGEYLNYWQRGYDNSVHARYDTLKEELITNKIHRLTKAEYYALFEEVVSVLATKQYKQRIILLKAGDIGVNNKKFNIPKNTPVTINHLLALKVATDCTELQKSFKRNCRKLEKNELLKDLIKRNRQIAHWSRLLKELCTFYGTLMKRNDVVYTGLNSMLLFTSLNNHFECPLSTTKNESIATNFAGDTGIILKLKRANAKTRYFNPQLFSRFKHEEERLFVGSSLQIVDIYINGKHSKNYISALYMFEQIISGQFVDAIQLKLNARKKIEEPLYQLLCGAMNLPTKHEPAPQYFLALFLSMIESMKKMYFLRSLRVNRKVLAHIQHKQLKQVLVSPEFFAKYGIDDKHVPSVFEFAWKIDGKKYHKFEKLKTRAYEESTRQLYHIDDKRAIEFHLECCAKYGDESENVAVFLHLDKLPRKMNQVAVECDLLCILVNDNNIKPLPRVYRHHMTQQLLSEKNNHIGSQIFENKELGKYTSIEWQIGIKVFDDELHQHNDITIDSVLSALHKDDKMAVVKYCKSLFARCEQLHVVNMQKDQKIKELQQERRLYMQSGNYETTPGPQMPPASPLMPQSYSETFPNQSPSLLMLGKLPQSRRESDLNHFMKNNKSRSKSVNGRLKTHQKASRPFEDASKSIE